MQITQRQATLGILAVHVLGAALFALSGLFQSTDVVLPLASGLDGVLTLGLLLAVWRGWYAARYIEIILTTLLIGALIPDPERSAQLDTAMYIAPVLALILADARWVVGTVVMLLAIVLIRTGGQGVYADPGSLIVYGVAIGGMVLASRVMVTAQRLAETNARQAELQAAELARYNIELARLNQLSARLQVCPTVVEATQIIAETLVDLFPTSSGTLYVRNQAAQEFHATARWGSNPPQAQVLSAISSEEFPHQLTDMVAFPLRAQEDTLGVLYIGRAPDIATDAEYQLLRAIADHSALALATIDLREQLQIQALHDPLTGLFNRRAMEEAFGRELHRAHRNQRALGVILLDLDYFKSFNDTRGHAAGDSVLRALSTLILTQTRASDIACRYGGEELLLILPDTEITPTWKRAEDLRMAVEALHIQHDGQPLGQVTISIGVATFPEHGTTAAALIHAADTALYQAKARGRNCVCVANRETQVPTTDHSMLSGEDR